MKPSEIYFFVFKIFIVLNKPRLRTEPILTQLNYLEIQLTQLNPLFNSIELSQPSQTQLIILRLKNSPYNFSVIYIAIMY